jgi:chemotaxis signal transduction protein
MPEAGRSARDDASAVLFWLGGQCCAVLADRVARVVGAHPITRLPLLPPEVPGVVALAGKVAPVLDLRRILGLPAADHRDGELVLVTIGGQTYALPVDRVLQIAVGSWTGESQWRDTPVRLVHIEEMLERCLPDGTATGAGLPSVELAQSAPIPVQQSPALRTRSAALAVETETSHDLLPLDCVVELSESLPTVAVPDPIFSGAALHRDALLPLLSLDALLGRPETNEDACGSFVVVDMDGRRCALAVKRVVGLSTDAVHVIDLQSLLVAPLLGPRSALRSTMPQQPQTSVGGTRYLLVELAGRTCAFALNSVAHIHAGCRVLRAPALTGGGAVGVIAIGGRVLPVLDLGALLGVPAQPQMHQFVELKPLQTDTFVVAIDRIMGIVAIEQDALVRSAEGNAISAVARLDAKLVWILSAPLIAEHGEATSDAA